MPSSGREAPQSGRHRSLGLPREHGWSIDRSRRLRTPHGQRGDLPEGRPPRDVETELFPDLSAHRLEWRLALFGRAPEQAPRPGSGTGRVMSKMWPRRPTARPSGPVGAPTTVGLSSVPQQRQLTGVSAVRLFRVAPLVAPALCPVGFHSPTRRSSLGQRHSPPPALASLRRLPAPRRRPPTAGIE